MRWFGFIVCKSSLVPVKSCLVGFGDLLDLYG